MSKAYKNLIPAGHIHIKDNVMEKECITGVSESRDLWAKDLNLPMQAEYTLFAGCGYQHMKYVEGMVGALKSASKLGMGMGKVVSMSKAFGKVGIDLTNVTAKVTASKTDPYTPVLVQAVNVLRKLGVDIGYLHEKEPCCGSPIYYSGFEKEYAEKAEKNTQLFKSLGVRKLIGIIPACTSTLKNGYPKYVAQFDIEIYHILEVIAERIKKIGGNIRVKEPMKVTYHDPCQLSRYMGVTREPREILRNIEGIELVEPDVEKIGRWSTCCGGGNMETSHPELSERMGRRRLEELKATGASVIVTNCPACEMQLNHTVKKMNADFKVLDLIHLVDEAL